MGVLLGKRYDRLTVCALQLLKLLQYPVCQASAAVSLPLCSSWNSSTKCIKATCHKTSSLSCLKLSSQSSQNVISVITEYFGTGAFTLNTKGHSDLFELLCNILSWPALAAQTSFCSQLGSPDRNWEKGILIFVKNEWKLKGFQNQAISSTNVFYHDVSWR